MSNSVEEIVYLVDDDAAVRDALSLLIRSIGIKSKAYGDPAAFLEDIQGDEIGCLVLDIRMPALNGFAVQERLSAMGSCLPIILITGHGDIAQCRRAFQNGAVDFLTKPIDENTLIESLQKAIQHGREQWASKRRTNDVRARLQKLTARERSIFDLVSDGLPNKVIADRLRLSLRTVETYRASVFEKLDASSTADLVKLKVLDSTWKKSIP
ncbi:response regulator transcription factor [Paraburkholderia denitrificans]|uniref:Response regulator transcription factor n=1 Tax=Paraburkholderia denitrificans TaxID=694025 RepID=A0ABW0J5M3_9BURK